MNLFADIETHRARLRADAADVHAGYGLALAYARAGATTEAEAIVRDLALTERFEAGRGALTMRFWEDLGCLAPRLAKDRALAAADPDLRRRGLRAAAEGYAAVARRTGGYYPMINAAALRHLAGDAAGACDAARDTLALLAGAQEAYWPLATALEAKLILGETAAAHRGLQAILALEPAPTPDMLMVTARQLRAIEEARGGDAAWLEPLTPAPVAHFCGHIIDAPHATGRFPAEAEAAARDALAAACAAAGARKSGVAAPFSAAYGALAAGADILVAEWMLAHGTPLHVVLPFSAEQFIETSVAPAGLAWVGRFRACFDQAAEVHIAAQASSKAQAPGLFAYGSRYAMGLAALRARLTQTAAVQIALYDGAPAVGRAGTAADVAAWSASGREQVVVSPPSAAPPARPPAAAAEGDALGVGAPPAAGVAAQQDRPILFADLKGFSRLADPDVLAVTTAVFGAFARVLAPHRASGELVDANTWGDALLVVMKTPAVAAETALELLSALDAAAVDLPRPAAPLGVRIGGHFGPVFEARNAVTGRVGVVGAHMSVGARVEPVAPVGAVWVTEHFAAALELSGPVSFDWEVVGRREMAKGFGSMRVFALRRA